MQTTAALYDTILADPTHYFETRLLVQRSSQWSQYVNQDKIFSIETSIEMFHGSPTIGSAVAGEITVKMIKPNWDIPVMGRITPEVRVCNANQQSQWITQGIYFIDTRQTSKNMDNLDILEIHGYDAMLKAEQPWHSNSITGDSTDRQMVDSIASIMGVSVDARTYGQMGKYYTIPLPVGYTCREILGYIASMYCGCFIITDTGKLRLVSMLELPYETSYLVTNNGDRITFGGDRILC